MTAACLAAIGLTAACSSDAGTSASPASHQTGLAGGSTPGAGTTGGTITIGVMADLSGTAGLFGPPSRDVAELAVAQINAAGGVNGKQVSMQFEDSASSTTTTKSGAQKLVQQDHVAALFGEYNSAQSQVALSVAAAANVPYFYAPVWEGGVCNPDLFANGEVPAQQLSQVIPWAQQNTGKKKWYLLGDDYVWPHDSFALAKQYITKAGGTVVGEDYVPLGTTDFSAEISKIQSSGANIMIPALVGSDAIAFEKQAYNAGLSNSKVQRLAILYEDNTRGAMGAKITSGMYFSTGYDQVISNPTNAAFLKAYSAKFGKSAPVMQTLSEQVYLAIKSWAQAANAAHATDLAAISKAISGMTIQGPAGTITWDADHYTTQPIYVDQIQADGTAKIVKSYPEMSNDQTCKF
jgi:ABC-type branched-subunit amino acid transport system substrate-binding protein